MSLRDSTHMFGANALYVAEIYERFLQDPSSVDESWRKAFTDFGDNPKAVVQDFYGAPWARERSVVVGYTPKTQERRRNKKGRRATDHNSASDDSIRAHMLIRAYRVRGHLIANLDPLGLQVRRSHPELDISRYGFSESDMDRPIFIGGWLGLETATLRQILSVLKQTYSSNIGLEYIHIQSLEKKEWLEKRMESSRALPSLTNQQRKNILLHLIEINGFEEFLHTKFPGAKRFSIEGGDNLIPAMETILDKSSELGVEEIVIGMPHRGRLNVLTAFMRKPYAAMLNEFQGGAANPDYISTSGDVKYHLGKSTDRELSGNRVVHLSLTANPSHLEAVNPVVAGKVRAKQDQRGDKNRDQVMGLLLHGDAAFCGQGIVSEGLAMADLNGYTIGGTVHIVVNNQVGFTTNPSDGHLSPYPTDVAMQAQAPIFHVNGDDPEAVVHAAALAAEFRQQFKKDVVLDIFCYRRRGHNEGDEPAFTQPKMYRIINGKPAPCDVYAERLIAEGVVSADDVAAMKKNFNEFLEKEFNASKSYKPNKADWFEGKWQGLEQGNKAATQTGVDLKTLKKIGLKITEKPEGVNVHPKIEKFLEVRRTAIDTGEGLDWGTAEALAFCTLLTEGFPVRLSGQDCIRGTFSHRHSGYTDQVTEEIYFPFNHLEEGQARYEVMNSNLSEYAVLGYEYGYSSADPKTLVLWEGQFGDFANGAQIMIDQFITSSEAKWLRMSGLVMLLPHGYEGQGPEHSSARLERFLQMCAEDNIQVVNATTPANYFHLLRRQMHRSFRKPLVVMSPKSLLRHKRATSTLAELAKGTSFQKVIGETEKLVADAKIKRVVVCSGKVYYDLVEEREAKGIKDIALVRLEQFYPFPEEQLAKELARYKGAEVVWCQEEPKNMGGWYFVDRRLEAAMERAGTKATRPNYAGRPEAASPACGYLKVHQAEQKKLVEDALNLGAAARNVAV